MACKEAFNAIIDAIIEIGWNPDTIKKLLLTHGHVDHVGCGRWFVEQYCVDTYLSREDDIFGKNIQLNQIDRKRGKTTTLPIM